MSNLGKCWNPAMSEEETKNLAYWERNMLALLHAVPMMNMVMPGTDEPAAGWYYHGDESYAGWSRVISIFGGAVTFHVPDDFDLGRLKEIQPNWDGHTTEEKWLRIMDLCGIDTSKTREVS